MQLSPSQQTTEAGYSRCVKRGLNGLQQMMLRWEELHPYNAVQIAYVCDSRVNAGSLRESLDLLTSELGFSTVSCDRSQKESLWSEDGTPIPIECQLTGELSKSFIESLVTRELNTRFDHKHACPFRVRLIEAPEGKLVVFTYRHFVSDAVGIAQLVRRILQLCVGSANQGEWKIGFESDSPGGRITDESASY